MGFLVVYRRPTSTNVSQTQGKLKSKLHNSLGCAWVYGGVAWEKPVWFLTHSFQFVYLPVLKLCKTHPNENSIRYRSDPAGFAPRHIHVAHRKRPIEQQHLDYFRKHACYCKNNESGFCCKTAGKNKNNSKWKGSMFITSGSKWNLCVFVFKKKVEKVFWWRHWKKKKYETQNYSMKIDWNAAAHIFFKEFRFFYPLRSKIFTAFILVIRYESRTLLIFDEREKKRWQFVLRFSFVCRMQFV